MAAEQTVGISPSIGVNSPNNPDGQNIPVIRRRKSKSTFKRNIAFYIMLLPGVIVLIINNYIPMIGVIMPFKDYIFNGNFFSSLFTSKFVGFENFKFLMSPDAFAATRNTVVYNLVFIALDLVVPVALAIAIGEIWKQTLGRIYQSFMFLPYFISWIAVSYIAYAFFCNAGFVDTNVLKLFGMQSIDYYSMPGKWPLIITFFHLWKYTGYNLIVYIASLSGISVEYYEAAALDGATKWQQIKYVTLPMLKTTMIILTLIAVGRIFNGDFDLFYNVPKNISQLYPTTDILDTYVYRLLMNLGDVGMAAAAGIYQAIVGCIVVLLANLAVKKVDSDSALF
jgi:putative aldouronate transport system permease protein